MNGILGYTSRVVRPQTLGNAVDVFRAVTPFSLIDCSQCIGETWSSFETLVTITLHGVTYQNTVIFTVADVRSSNLELFRETIFSNYSPQYIAYWSFCNHTTCNFSNFRTDNGTFDQYANTQSFAFASLWLACMHPNTTEQRLLRASYLLLVSCLEEQRRPLQRH